jgi:ubiquitin-protein ligase
MSTSKNDEIEFRKWKLLIELKHLPRHVDGVYSLPSLNSLFEWHGVIFLRQGLYRGGIFKFKFELPSNYPASGPSKVTFNQTSIPFHPQIKSDTGELSLARAEFANWNGEIHGVAHVLKV